METFKIGDCRFEVGDESSYLIVKQFSCTPANEWMYRRQLLGWKYYIQKDYPNACFTYNIEGGPCLRISRLKPNEVETIKNKYILSRKIYYNDETYE